MRRRGRYPRHSGSPLLPVSPFQRAVPITPADRTSARVDCFLIRAAFPVSLAGRHPHLHFRGLLRLHSRYGPQDRSAAQGGLRHEASARQLPNRAARQLPDQSTSIWAESSSTGDTRLSGHTAKSGAFLRPSQSRISLRSSGLRRVNSASSRRRDRCRTRGRAGRGRG
jgi:hypothetical protein